MAQAVKHLPGKCETLSSNPKVPKNEQMKKTYLSLCFLLTISQRQTNTKKTFLILGCISFPYLKNSKYFFIVEKSPYIIFSSTYNSFIFLACHSCKRYIQHMVGEFASTWGFGKNSKRCFDLCWLRHVFYFLKLAT
jgi:hypothetical protein